MSGPPNGTAQRGRRARGLLGCADRAAVDPPDAGRPASMMLIGGPTLSGVSRISASSSRRAMSTPGNIESTCCWPVLILRVARGCAQHREPFEVQCPRGDDHRVVLDAGDQEPDRHTLQPMLVSRDHELDGFLVPQPLLEVLPGAVAAFAEELRQAGQLGPDHAGQRVGALLHRAGPRGAGLGEGGFDRDGAALSRHEAGNGYDRVAVALDLADSRFARRLRAAGCRRRCRR